MLLPGLAGPCATPGQPAPVLAAARATQVASLRTATLACAVRVGMSPVFVALPAMAAVKHWLHQQRLHAGPAEPPCSLVGVLTTLLAFLVAAEPVPMHH